MDKVKIVISGIGGVGGYIGGMLASYYESSTDIHVNFLARGENEQKIRDQGLLLDTPSGKHTARPAQVTSNAEAIGRADFIICCTKSYDLLQNLEQLKPCIHQSTVILPLLNGVNHREEIQQILPNNEIWEGCIYIIARLVQPGLVKVTSKIARMYFGAANGSKEKRISFEKICQRAAIDAHAVENIEYRIWEKFLFISSTATLSSYLDVPLGEIKTNEKYMAQWHLLLAELQTVANAKGIIFPENIIEKNISLLDNVQPDATTSMHSDFRNGKPTEVAPLTGYVVALGKSLGVNVPTYEKIYGNLLR